MLTISFCMDIDDNVQKGHIYFPIDKVVSVYADKWENGAGITTIDLVNGFSYQIFHSFMDMEHEIDTVLNTESLEGTIFEQTVIVKNIKRIETK